MSDAPDIDLISDTPQIHPPLVPASQNDHSEESRDLITRNFAHFREDPLSFLKDISLHYSGTGWRKYEDPIGQPIFYKGFTENMKNRLLTAPVLRQKVESLAERRVQREGELGLFKGEDGAVGRERRKGELVRQLAEVADGIVDGMICKFESKPFIRVSFRAP